MVEPMIIGNDERLRSSGNMGQSMDRPFEQFHDQASLDQWNALSKTQLINSRHGRNSSQSDC